MNAMKTTLTTLLLLTALGAHAALEARYFRAWQGFKKPGLSERSFVAALPQFMIDTVELYRKNNILSSYIVIVPPASKPSFVPDEFALVALESHDGYQRVRSTPEGQHYSARHWDVFNRENSASADMIDFSTVQPQALEHNKSYDVLGSPIDWSRGHQTVYIGVRKANLDRAEYLRQLSAHVAMVKRAFAPKGLRGYVVIANQDYEVAFMNWDSQSAMEGAFQTHAGQLVSADGARLMNPLMFESANSFNPQSKVFAGKGYRAAEGVHWQDLDIIDAH